MMFFGSSARLTARIISTAPVPASLDEEAHLVQADAVLAGAGALEPIARRTIFSAHALGQAPLIRVALLDQVGGWKLPSPTWPTM